jgi:hypothetical protein
VEDTGPGISRQDQARIFEPFVQAGQTGTQKGTGLGLTITSRFVEMTGGTIEVESAPGRGYRRVSLGQGRQADLHDLLAGTDREEGTAVGLEEDPDTRQGAFDNRIKLLGRGRKERSGYI